jgi:hypothetical protein
MESLSIIALESALSAKSIGPLERIVLDKCNVHLNLLIEM